MKKRINNKWVFAGLITLLLLAFAVLMYIAEKNNKAQGVFASAFERQPTIIIDAGHGGADGGAQAADGTLEKDINFSIALKLNSMLKSMGLKTVMTRTQDISIHTQDAKGLRQQKTSDLHRRLKIMEETKNPIFISIHQNHFTSPKYSGAQVFYSGNTADSSALAQSIQESIVSRIQPENSRQIKKSGAEIYVLYKAKSTAVMVECGFLSNAAETQKLKNNEYQNKMAFSIMCGLIDYLGGQNGSDQV